MKAELYTDGSNAADWSRASGGFVLIFSSGEKLEGQGLAPESFRNEKGKFTNIAGEYLGLGLGLRAAVDAGVTDLSIFCDNETMIRQVTGAYQVRKKNMIPVHARVMSLLGQIPKWSIGWVSGGVNPADELSRVFGGESELRRTVKGRPS